MEWENEQKAAAGSADGHRGPLVQREGGDGEEERCSFIEQGESSEQTHPPGEPLGVWIQELGGSRCCINFFDTELNSL